MVFAKLYQYLYYSVTMLRVSNFSRTRRNAMFDELNEDLKGKVKECKTAEELAALAETEGFELSNEMLDAVSGGVTDEVCISL